MPWPEELLGRKCSPFFDTRNYRAPGGRHCNDRQAIQRAIRRTVESREASSKRSGRTGETSTRHILQSAAVVNPTFNHELQLFEAIFRHISKHEVDENHVKWFQADSRPQKRRIVAVGITGNQPAISAYCKKTNAEHRQVAEALLQQKVGHNIKTAKQLKQFWNTTDEGNANDDDINGPSVRRDTILIKLSRIAYGATIR